MSEKTEKKKKSRPTLTAEARENEMIALAVDLAEKQLREGTATSQVICHYLRLGSTKERYEKELLKKEVELKSAKAEALQEAKLSAELYQKAIDAMRLYSGNAGGSDDEPID